MTNSSDTFVFRTFEKVMVNIFNILTTFTYPCVIQAHVKLMIIKCRVIQQ